MPSFQRDVTQTMNVGAAQAPVARPSLEGLASMATFAIDKYQSHKKNERREELLQQAEALYQQALETAKSAEGDKKTAAQQFFKKGIKDIALSHEELTIARQVWASNTGVGLERSEFEATISPEERAKLKVKSEAERAINNDKLLEHIVGRVKDPDIIARVDMGTASHEDYVEIQRIERELVVDSARYKQAVEQSKSKDFHVARAGLNNQFNEQELAINKGIASFKAVMTGLTDLPTTEQSDKVAQATSLLKSSITSLRDRMDVEVENRIAEQGFTGEQETSIRKMKDARMKKYDGMLKTLDTLKDEQLARVPDVLKNMKAQLGIEGLDALGFMARFDEVSQGRLLPQLFEMSLIKDGQSLQHLTKSVDEVVANMLSDGGITEAEANKITALNTLRLYTEVDPDMSQADVQNFYRTFGSQIKSGNLPEGGMLSAGVGNLIEILKLAEDSPSVEDRDKATELLNSSGFSKLMSSSDLNDQDKAALGNMVTNFNQDKVTDSNSMVLTDIIRLGSNAKYDATTGKMVVTKAALSESDKELMRKEVAAGRMSPRAAKERLNTADKKQKEVVKKFNDAVDSIYQYKEHDEYFKGMSKKQIGDFLVTFSTRGNELNIEGSLTNFAPEDKQAQEAGVSGEKFKQEVERLKDVDVQLDKLLLDLGGKSLSELSKGLDSATKQAMVPVLQGVASTSKPTTTGDEDIVQIMKENPNLTYAEALELKKKVSQ